MNTTKAIRPITKRSRLKLSILISKILYKDKVKRKTLKGQIVYENKANVSQKSVPPQIGRRYKHRTDRQSINAGAGLCNL